jgi:hypothetical protein
VLLQGGEVVAAWIEGSALDRSLRAMVDEIRLEPQDRAPVYATPFGAAGSGAQRAVGWRRLSFWMV